MKRIERMFRYGHQTTASREKLIVSLIAFAIVALVSTDALMAKVDPIEKVSDQSSKLGFSPTPWLITDTIRKNNQTEVVEKKEVTVEMKDGKIVKAVVNGKEIPPDEFEKMKADMAVEMETVIKPLKGSMHKPDRSKRVEKVIVIQDGQCAENIQTTENQTIITPDGKKIVIIEKNVGPRHADKFMPADPGFEWHEKSLDHNTMEHEILITDSILDGDSTRVMVFINDSVIDLRNIENYKLERQHEIRQLQHERLKREHDLESMQWEIRELPEIPELPEVPFMGVFAPKLSLQDDLWIRELFDSGLVGSQSHIILSRKQLIINNQVLDKKTQRHFLNRFEEINGRKLENDEAISLRTR